MGRDTDQTDPLRPFALPSVGLCSLSGKPVLTKIANCRPCSRFYADLTTQITLFCTYYMLSAILSVLQPSPHAF